MRQSPYRWWLLGALVLGLAAGILFTQRHLLPEEQVAGRTATLSVGQPTVATLVAFSRDKQWLAVVYQTCYHLRQSMHSEGSAELSIGEEPRCWQEDERSFRYAYTNLFSRVVEEVTAGDVYAFSADRELLAWVDPREQEVTVWETDSARVVGRYSGFAGKVTAIAFSGDNQTIAVATRQGSVYLWNRSSPQASARRVRAHRGAVTAVALSGDGSTIVTAGEDRAIRVWRLTSRRVVRLASTDSEGVTGLAISPSGEVLLSYARGGETVLWQLPGLRRLQQVEWRLQMDGVVRSIGFSADSGSMEVVAKQRTLCLWNLAEGKLEAVFEPQGGLITSLTFAPDSSQLLIGDHRGKIYVWRLGEAVPERVVPVCEASISAISISPDGATVCVGSSNGEVHLLQARSYRRLRSWLRAHKGMVQQLAWGDNGRSAISVGRDGWLVVYHLPTARVSRQRLSSVVQLAAFSESGDRLALQGARQLEVWEIAGGEAKPLFTYSERSAATSLHLVDGYLYAVEAGNLHTFRLEKGASTSSLPLRRAFQTAATLSADGSLLASGEGNNVALLSRRDGKLIASFQYAKSPEGYYWLIALPSGEYTCVEKAVPLVRWQEDGRLRDEPSSLASAYRPEKVRQRLRQACQFTSATDRAASPPR